MAPAAFDVTASEVLGHIRHLAADALAGRGIGQRGLEVATDCHERLFKAWGLEPLFGGSYRQPISLLGSKPNPEATP